MRKIGFTLAEVLITLMIIGVVATLTTPALVKNVGSSKIGPQLSKFVNTFETAAETMMMEEGVSTMSGNSVSFGPGGMEKLSKYMIMTNLRNTTNPSSIDFKKGDGSSYFSEKLSRGYSWMLKDGTIVVVDPLSGGARYSYNSESGSYKGGMTQILVDIGGLKGSHRVGKEVFSFIIDESGVLVPYASNAHKSMCKNLTATCSPSSSNTEENFACTGAVADNGWKATW